MLFSSITFVLEDNRFDILFNMQCFEAFNIKNTAANQVIKLIDSVGLSSNDLELTENIDCAEFISLLERTYSMPIQVMYCYGFESDNEIRLEASKVVKDENKDICE